MRNIIPTILIVASIWIVFGYGKARYDDLKQLKVMKADYKKALDDARLVQKIRDEKYTEFDSIPLADKEKLAIFLPEKINIARLLLNVSSLAKSHNLSLSDVKVSGIENESSVVQNPYDEGVIRKEEKAKSADVVMSFGGKYSDFVKFLEEAENSLTLLDATSVSFKQDPTNKNSNFSVTFRTYWLP